MEKTESLIDILFTNKIYSPLISILLEEQETFSMGIPSNILLKNYMIKINRRIGRQWINRILNDLIRKGIVTRKGTRSIFFYSIPQPICALLLGIKERKNNDECSLNVARLEEIERRKIVEKTDNPWLKQKNALELYHDIKKAEKSSTSNDE